MLPPPSISNLFLSHGSFPSKCKHTQIFPIFETKQYKLKKTSSLDLHFVPGLYVCVCVFTRILTVVFPDTSDLYHSGCYMKMVLRRSSISIQFIESNRIISKLILLYLPAKLGIWSLRVLRDFVLCTSVNRMYVCLLTFLLPNQVFFHFSLTLNSSGFSCQWALIRLAFHLILSLEKCLTLLRVCLPWIHSYGIKLASLQRSETFLYQPPDLQLEIFT